ncbi:Uncharacterized conserved protein, DUF1015 family [Fodinibius roseus]|uniref:Uncharacterized conserved protein, DUF1015 family n=1 Tax=Fodinibius roseus TaxID=1194090 RepID=A0A1M4ZJ32_9BACT|nr:DUF1015 family protein [Fodinibius roseus]SHF17988.1 Uncharacterized conserved protein, DUF1015 family [Fodinibius roseus]
MAHLHPFKAWRPAPENVEEIACVPYDVINVNEARTLAKGKPNSFLHVIRPEIDLPEDIDPYDGAVYEKGAENLSQLLSDNILQQEEEPCIYIYRLIWKGSPQTGIFSCVPVQDYNDEVILKHELTRPKKEDDRTRHITTQQAHAEPVMITFKDDDKIQQLIEGAVQEDPLYDFVASDGVTHQLWKVQKTTPFEEVFEDIPKLYIADGHHRCKSASRAAAEERGKNDNHTGTEEYNFFPAVVFPMSDMRILSYNRIVHDIPDDFLSQLGERFELRKDADPKPSQKGDLSIYIDGAWYGTTLPVTENPNSVEKLDVHRLQEFLLDPMLDITDPRRDKNISFVGGIRGTGELERLVDEGEAGMAISMYPTSIEELIEVSDEGLLMPPKSTWFEPKLRSGLLVHTF